MNRILAPIRKNAPRQLGMNLAWEVVAHELIDLYLCAVQREEFEHWDGFLRIDVSAS